MNGLQAEFIAPENSFEEEIIKFCIKTANTVIQRNRKYGDSYRNLRIKSKNTHKNVKLPIWIHQNEKLDRYSTIGAGEEESEEDTCIDGAGYWCLENTCRRLDDGN